MKPLKPNRLLHTTVLSLLLAATMGVSACSSEKEGDNAQSGDATGTNQSSDVDTSSSGGDAPLTENDSNIGAGEGSGTSANNEVNATNPSGSTDNMGNSVPDTNINSDRDENPNLDQTPADGVQ